MEKPKKPVAPPKMPPMPKIPYKKPVHPPMPPKMPPMHMPMMPPMHMPMMPPTYHIPCDPHMLHHMYRQLKMCHKYEMKMLKWYMKYCGCRPHKHMPYDSSSRGWDSSHYSRYDSSRHHDICDTPLESSYD
ncbi:hypothetical protein ACFO25_14820 [Paenactinomyces guangxiensis]|uniref:Uncharacterized protein n=1 Tax=Paenactinomyces guangxiensis TaxID=1490290 RepID=A0A7W1WPU7_9BACL|nr:hypothetical protein [Paenactinomyces guangxiensis]MBA4493868.1 hypothetical protein [Paenactinomyces guangxiensis]MBH8591334.1 hypothetical protein [Paenactinomyces guangxiensis]